MRAHCFEMGELTRAAEDAKGRTEHRAAVRAGSAARAAGLRTGSNAHGVAEGRAVCRRSLL